MEKGVTMPSAESFLMMLPQSIPAKDRVTLGLIAEVVADEREKSPDVALSPDAARQALYQAYTGGKGAEILAAMVQVAARYARIVADHCLLEMDEETKRSPEPVEGRQEALNRVAKAAAWLSEVDIIKCDHWGGLALHASEGEDDPVANAADEIQEMAVQAWKELDAALAKLEVEG